MDAFREFDELAATAQHIQFIRRKLDSLQRAYADSWAQILTRAAAMYREGALTIDDLIRLLDSMAEEYDSGYTGVWDQHMPVKYRQINGEKLRRQMAEKVAEAKRETARLNAPNGPHGTWHGELPVSEPPYPLKGISVVYVLYDAANKPVYVGSTADFRARMNAHVKEKPDARRWVAYPCADREAAYQLEVRLLIEHKLPLNKKASR